MSLFVSLDSPKEILRSSVDEVVRRPWVRPRARNVVVPGHLSAGAQECFVADASSRYRVCWDALRMGAQIFPDRERLLALYLDGSEHHRTQTALHMTSVDKGQMTQPWQGEGVLLDNGHGKLEPYVLTGSRRSCYYVRTIDGLNLVAAPGFDHLAIVWSQTSAASSPNVSADTATPLS